MIPEKIINAIKQQIRSTENVILKPSTIVPIATLEQLVLEYEYLQEQLKKCNKETIQKEVGLAEPPSVKAVKELLIHCPNQDLVSAMRQ